MLSEGYDTVSPATWTYNCIAFAGDITNGWWWPDSNGEGFWPDGITRETTIPCFIKAYETLGYKVCASPSLEPNFEKIAIYAERGEPTHAAKQLPDGRWKSKLGPWEDIEHNTTKAVEEYLYGKVVVYLRRRDPSWQKTSPLAKFRSFLLRTFGKGQSTS